MAQVAAKNTLTVRGVPTQASWHFLSLRPPAVVRGSLMPSEADTCRKLVVPELQAAGWEVEPHSIAEQRSITDGRIVPVGKGFIRKPPKRVDYLLRYTRDFPLAVVEAKPSTSPPPTGCSRQAVCRDARPQVRLCHQRS